MAGRLDPLLPDAGPYTEHLDLPNDPLLDAISEAVRWHWDEPLPRRPPPTCNWPI